MKVSPLAYLLATLLFLTFNINAQETTSLQKSTVPAENSATESKPKYEVQLQLSSESLTRGFGIWRSATVYAERRFDNRRIVWGSFRASDRNGNRDKEFTAGVYQPFRGKWAMTAEAMYSPTRRFVGKYSAMVEVEKGLRKGFVAHVGTRFTKYTTVSAATGYGLVEKYWGANRLAYTLYVTRLSNAGTAPSQRLQYNRYYGERNNTVGVAFSYGKEHENLGPRLGILRSRTWSTSVSARHWFTSKFGISIDGTYHRQGSIYDRRGLTIGLRYRF